MSLLSHRPESQIQLVLVVSILLIGDAIIIDGFSLRKHLGSELSIQGVFWKEIAGDRLYVEFYVKAELTAGRSQRGASGQGGTG